MLIFARSVVVGWCARFGIALFDLVCMSIKAFGRGSRRPAD